MNQLIQELEAWEQMIIQFKVPAVPVAQPRARATSIGGHARVYEPTKHPIAAFKASVRMAAEKVFTGAPLQGALRVDCCFVFPRPKTLIWKLKPMPRMWHTKKPDRDNCDKAILDALSGLIWADDCQVCDGTLEKWVASGYEQPHVMVKVTQLDVREVLRGVKS